MKSKTVLSIICLLILTYSCKDEQITPATTIDALQLSYTATDVSEYGASDGSIDLTVTGGVSPYTYTWSNDNTTEDLVNISAGIYIVTVNDSNDSTVVEEITINEGEADSLAISAIINYPSSVNQNDGYIIIEVSGGASPYTYLWSTGETSSTLSSIGLGTYTVTVTDSREESLTDTFIIDQAQSNELTVTDSVIMPSDKYTEDGSILISVSGGTPPYSYSWSDGSTDTILNNIGNGTYGVTITDDNVQTYTDSYTLEAKSLTDYDGNEYDIVKIGDQIWMATNLKVTHNPDGNEITCYDYIDDESYTETYGKLYTWTVAMDGSTDEKAQGICPEGYHIPSDGEWQDLEIALGMSEDDASTYNTWRGDGIGTALKDGGSSGYNALLSGRRNSSGTYSLVGQYEYMWSSTEYANSNAYRRCLSKSSTQIGRWNTFPKTYGFSVRCVKD